MGTTTLATACTEIEREEEEEEGEEITITVGVSHAPTEITGLQCYQTAKMARASGATDAWPAISAMARGPILKDFATSQSQENFTVSATSQNLSEWGLSGNE